MPSTRTRPHKKHGSFAAPVLLWAVLLRAVLLSSAAPEKHLSVFSVAANYSLPLVQRDRRDYVGLLEVLEPLGKVTARSEGSRWRLRYNSSVEGDFQAGKSRARIQGRDADLGGKFLIENGRGLVPLTSLSSLLPRFLGGPVSLREETGRLFIGGVATHFTATLSGEKLVFNFTAAVNPTIANQPGALRMTFSREPIVAPASPTLTFGSKTFPSANYSEGNGAAIVTVNTSTPVMASFSNSNRTIVISPAPPAAQNVAATPAPAASNPQTSSSSSSASSPTTTTAAPAVVPTPAPPPRRYFAVIDASHGGDDHGETLSTTLLEKDITVVLARSLRQELESRGLSALVLRDSDANLSLDQRATYANADHAAIYIALHAASSGRGVRIYTALLPYADDDRGPFRSWDTAQHAWLPLSQSTATAVAAELQKRQIPVRSLAAPLRPLNNVSGAAIAIEMAPQGSDVSQLTAPDYQQLIVSAVAMAIAANRDQLGAAP
jgi:N-acetylmuramoyl-L-alanine amidase